MVLSAGVARETLGDLRSPAHTWPAKRVAHPAAQHDLGFVLTFATIRSPTKGDWALGQTRAGIAVNREETLIRFDVTGRPSAGREGSTAWRPPCRAGTGPGGIQRSARPVIAAGTTLARGLCL